MSEIVIVELNKFREDMDKAKESANFIPDVSDSDGYDKSKRVSLDIGKILTALDKTRKEKKAYFLQGGRDVDSQAKEIREELEQMQLPHKEAYKQLDAEKKEREQKRKDELQSRVDEMLFLVEGLADSCSDEIKAAIEHVQANECLDFYEFTESALKTRNKAVKELSELFAKTLQAEKDAEELAALKAADEKRKQQEREDAIKKEASAKAEAEKNAAIERENEAKRLAEQAEIDKLKAEKDALELSKKLEDAAKQKAIDEKQAAKDAAHAEKMAAEKARQEELLKQKEALEAEIAEKEKREANKKHVGKIRGGAKDDLMAIGLDEEAAKKVVLAITNNKISNITINY